MIANTIIEKIRLMPDSEKGGDNALDGFEFQISAAIYLMFKEIKNKNDFALIYEKIEDFIIFTNEISLYQAKSISKNLTPYILYDKKANQNSKKNISVKLSIIEKMNNNYTSIKKEFLSCSINNNLVICENQIFSKKLSPKIIDLKDKTILNFDSLDPKVKTEIISKTGIKNYDWSNMNAVRLIPKNRHEEVTRIFIEDVINNIVGDNKIDSLALYNALTSEIRKIRKNKSKLTNDFIMTQINKFASFEDDLKYCDYVHLLNKEDKNKIFIGLSFNNYQNYIKIKNHPSVQDYSEIKKYFKSNKFSDVDEIFDSIKANCSFNDICLRLDEYEIKAIILLAIAKEMS